MVDYQKLKQLRVETEVSFSLCKKALEETNNNIEAAKKKITEWGGETLSKKASKVTLQGIVVSYVHYNKKVASLIELQTETDFVSRNEEFQHLAQELAMQAASVPATSVDELLKQEYIRDAKKTVQDLIKDAAIKFGENIKLARFLRWEVGQA